LGGELVLHRRCEQWVLNATAKLGLQGRQCEQRVLNAATKLRLQGRGREKWMLNAAAKLGLQGCGCEERVLNASALQGSCEQRVLNASALQGSREQRVLNASALQGSCEQRVLNASALLGSREQWVLHASAKLGLQGPQRKQRVLNAATKLGLQGRRREQWVLNATTKLGLQGPERKQRMLNAATKLGLQGRRREQWVLNATTKLGLQGPQREQRVLNVTAILGLQGRQRKKRVLNAAALQGSREERVLGCHSSQAISLRGIVSHHKLVLLYYCLLNYCFLTAAPCSGRISRPAVRTNCDGVPNRCCHSKVCCRMRPLPHLRQLLQMAVSDSHSSERCLAVGVAFHLGSVAAFKPVPQFALAESPLSADPERWDLSAPSPKAKSSGRHAKPPRDRSCGEEWFWSGRSHLSLSLDRRHRQDATRPVRPI
jgi:hypothetical protein